MAAFATKIQAYFDEVELALITAPAVSSFSILRREIILSEGKFRISIKLRNGDRAELFEYVREIEGTLRILKYSYHWQRQDGTLVRRWDNARHHPELEYFPDHVHIPGGKPRPKGKRPNMLSILTVMKRYVPL